LYTWGTGRLGELCDPQATFIAKPRRVDSSLLLSCQSSVCYKTVTAVITSGGSLTFFGQIGGERNRYLNKLEPSLIQLGHTIYVVDVVVGDCFAAALTSITIFHKANTLGKGEIYILSESLAHQKLSIPGNFRSVLIRNNTLYALTADGKQLLEWDYAIKIGSKSNSSFISTENYNQTRLNELCEDFTKQPTFAPCSESGHPIIIFSILPTDFHDH
jgi:hypothetical protein